MEELSFGKSQLLNKYNLSKGLDFLKIMHPMHLKYVSKPQANTLDYFFSVMNDFDSKKRDEILQFAYEFFIAPRYKKPVTGKEKMRDLMIDKADYVALKEKCYALKSNLTEFFLVKSIVNLTLEWAFHFADKTSVDVVIEHNKSMIKYMKEKLKDAKDEETAMILGLIKDTEKKVKDLPKQTEEWYSLYSSFCEQVLRKLTEESIMDKIGELED